jgi:hypothetical protein
MKTTYNQAWQKLFAELDVQENLDKSGLFRVSAEQIKSITGKEARIMAKWDSREARPEILRNSKVTILPTSRSGYVLVQGDGYQDLPEAEVAGFHSPKKIESFTTLPWREELTKESVAIDVAALSSMLKEFTGEEDLALTIRGRSGTSEFSFNFRGSTKNHQIEVKRAQIEIDAGFEGERVWLVEAKIGEPEDFLVRQLFYPWRQWKMDTPKEVMPVFLCYANRAFGLFRYEFRDQDDYHSIQLVEKRWFTLDRPEAIESLGDLFQTTRQRTPTSSIFPQADTLGTVVAAVELYASEATTTQEVSVRLGFDPRQGDYYTTAAEWVGFVERIGARRRLSAAGKNFVASSRTKRFKILFQAIASTPIFRDFIRRRLNGEIFGKGEIAEQILAKGYASQTTPNRRATTVLTWLDWLWREHANLSAVN